MTDRETIRYRGLRIVIESFHSCIEWRLYRKRQRRDVLRDHANNRDEARQRAQAAADQLLTRNPT